MFPVIAVVGREIWKLREEEEEEEEENNTPFGVNWNYSNNNRNRRQRKEKNNGNLAMHAYVCMTVSLTRLSILSVPPPAWCQRCRSWSVWDHPWPGRALGRAEQRSHLWLHHRAECRWSPDRCIPRRPLQGRGAAQVDPQLSDLLVEQS